MADFNLSLYVLHGKTGSGKTAILHELEKCGIQIIDLEQLSHHRGSVFGRMPHAPTISRALFLESLEDTCNLFDSTQPTFIEWKGKNMGSITLPPKLVSAMTEAPVVIIKSSPEQRIGHLVSQYKKLPLEHVYQAFFSLKSSLEESLFRTCLKALDDTDYQEFVRTIIQYYDHSTGYYIPQNRQILSIDGRGKNHLEIANEIISKLE